TFNIISISLSLGSKPNSASRGIKKYYLIKTTLRSPFFIIEEELPLPFSRKHSLPATSTFRMAYTQKLCWNAPSWWIALQWHDAKHAYIYCLEIHTKSELNIVLKCFCDDMHWLYMLKGEISISDKQNQQTLGEELHTQYVTLTDKTNLSVRCGRHLLIGFTVAKDWLTRYMADGLDFLLP